MATAIFRCSKKDNETLLVAGIGKTPSRRFSNGGVELYGHLVTPAVPGFRAGEFHIVQLIDPLGSRTFNGAVQPMNFQFKKVLDVEDPQAPGKLNDIVKTPFDALDKAWRTDNKDAYWADHPSTPLGSYDNAGRFTPIPQLTKVKYSASFVTYVMYRPAGLESQWTPYRTLYWDLSLALTLGAGNKWTFDAAPVASFNGVSLASQDKEDSPQEPQWTEVLGYGKVFP